MSATAFQRMRREAEAKAKASQKQADEVENKEVVNQVEEQQATDEVDKQEQEAFEQSETGINLDDMSVDELIQYAEEHGIDIGSASSQKGILKKIKEAE